MVDNRDSYVFSALTASIDADVSFTPLTDRDEGSRVGLLHIPMDDRFIINDGQHRRAAIELALTEDPSLGDETIAVVFFIDLGLERCQQMFADLNRHAVRPSPSLGVLYDHRDAMASLTDQSLLPSRCSVISSRWSARALPTGRASCSRSARSTRRHERSSRAATIPQSLTAVVFWEGVAERFPEWQLVREERSPAATYDAISSTPTASSCTRLGGRQRASRRRSKRLEGRRGFARRTRLGPNQRQALGRPSDHRRTTSEGRTERHPHGERSEEAARHAADARGAARRTCVQARRTPWLTDLHPLSKPGFRPAVTALIEEIRSALPRGPDPVGRRLHRRQGLDGHAAARVAGARRHRAASSAQAGTCHQHRHPGREPGRGRVGTDARSTALGEAAAARRVLPLEPHRLTPDVDRHLLGQPHRQGLPGAAAQVPLVHGATEDQAVQPLHPRGGARQRRSDPRARHPQGRELRAARADDPARRPARARPAEPEPEPCRTRSSTRRSRTGRTTTSGRS